jgi:hypothetical protein
VKKTIPLTVKFLFTRHCRRYESMKIISFMWALGK